MVWNHGQQQPLFTPVDLAINQPVLNEVLHGLFGEPAQFGAVAAIKACLDFARGAAGELKPPHHVMDFGEFGSNQLTGLRHQPRHRLDVIDIDHQLRIGGVGALGQQNHGEANGASACPS